MFSLDDGASLVKSPLFLTSFFYKIYRNFVCCALIHSFFLLFHRNSCMTYFVVLGKNIAKSCSFSFQPGPRDGAIQCFIKRDKSNLTYHLFLCLSPGEYFFKLLIGSICMFVDVPLVLIFFTRT